jgi:anti-sigma B factor antagonist
VDLRLQTRRQNCRTVLEVEGDVDVYTAPKLRDCLSELVADAQYDIILDLTKVGFLDSVGLGVLVGGLKKVRSHDGQLALVYNHERINKIFQVTGLVRVFPIYNSVDKALQDIEPISL